MNKTISINLAGIVFYIDEGALQVLQAYLERIQQNLHHTVGREEILADVEARIAELFEEELKKTGKQAVSAGAVGRVIGILGQPEDYPEGEKDGGARTARDKAPRSLYRDPDHKVLAGVASGLAAYTGIHRTWIRILFVLLSFFTSGGAVILYALLWISIPYAKTTSEKLEMRGEPVNFDTIKKNVSHTNSRLKEKLDPNLGFFEKWLGEIGSLLGALLKATGYFILLVLLLLAAILLGILALSALDILSWSWHLTHVGPGLGSLGDFFFFVESHFHLVGTTLALVALSVWLIALILKTVGGKKGAQRTANLRLLGLSTLLFIALATLWHMYYRRL